MSVIKKILSAVLAASVLLCVGCSGGNSENESTSASESDSVNSGSSAESTAEESTPEAPDNEQVDLNIYIEDGVFKVGGEKIWMNGMNTPWHKWDDFGGGYDAQWWREVFGAMHEDGMNSARVWLTCTGTTGFEFNDSGEITGMTDKFWNDLDSLFEIARENRIYIMATLISFDHFKNGNKDEWRAIAQESDKMDSFVNNYVIPLVERYDDNPYLWSIDLCNEPDWIYENEECGQLSWDCLGELFARSASAIHEHSDDILVTIGFGIIKYNSDKYEGNYGSDEFLQSRYNNKNAYCDFWSVHYYDWQLPWFSSMFLKTPEEFGIDTSKPFVVGECGSEGIAPKKYAKSLSECYQWAYDNGWCGVLPWNQYGLEPDKEFKTYIEEAAVYIDGVINSADNAA